MKIDVQEENKKDEKKQSGQVRAKAQQRALIFVMYNVYACISIGMVLEGLPVGMYEREDK